MSNEKFLMKRNEIILEIILGLSIDFFCDKFNLSND